MPLYSFICTVDESHPTQDHWSSISGRDTLKPTCACGGCMQRLPGGVGLLYFEEGRARLRSGLSDKPITSHAEHERLKRLNGVSEAGDNVPANIRRNPRTKAMQDHLAKDQKGRWI